MTPAALQRRAWQRHGHFNSVRPSIKFMVELEKDGTFPFFDTLLRRKGDGTLDVTVYQKPPPPTICYLEFRSHHSPHVKRGLVRCLFDRARNVTSSQDILQKEECHLAKVLQQNGYPGLPAIHLNEKVPKSPLPKKGTDHPWWLYSTLRGSARTSDGYTGSLA